jgi:ankyrin repeat protein
VRLSGGAECVNLIDPITQEPLAATIPLKYRIEIPTGRVNAGGVILVYCYDIRTLAQSFHSNKKNPLTNLPFSEDEDLLVLRFISELLPRVSESDVETVRILKTFIADIIGPRPRDEIGNTPVVRAIMNKKFKLARALLHNPSCGSVNDMINENQEETLLTWSIERTKEYNDFEAFNFLLQNGADVNKENYFGETPLIVAAHQYPKNFPVNLDVIRALCERGARINAVKKYSTSKNIYNALALLSKNPHHDTRDVMQYLLDHGANLHGGIYYNINEEYTVPLYHYLAERWILLKNHYLNSLILKRNALFIYEKFGVVPDPEFVSAEP